MVRQWYPAPARILH